MINPDMKTYEYFTYGEEDAYGQKVLNTEKPENKVFWNDDNAVLFWNEDSELYWNYDPEAEKPATVRMAIYLSNQSVQDNINYKECQYVGFTLSKMRDNCVIKYGSELLKVLYTNNQGRYTQVYMSRI